MGQQSVSTQASVGRGGGLVSTRADDVAKPPSPQHFNVTAERAGDSAGQVNGVAPATIPSPLRRYASADQPSVAVAVLAMHKQTLHLQQNQRGTFYTCHRGGLHAKLSKITRHSHKQHAKPSPVSPSI